MDQQPMFAGRPYAFRIGTQSIASGSVTAIKYMIDINTGAQLAARALSLNEIGAAPTTLLGSRFQLAGMSAPRSSARERSSSGLSVCPARENRLSPTLSNRSRLRRRAARCCWMLTISGTL
jgi:hypothetical protein